MTKSVEVWEKLVDLLQENLVDPNKERRKEDQQFVFKSTDQAKSKFPRIIVKLLDNQKTGLSVGSTDRFHRKRLQVSVQVGNKNKFDIPEGDKKDELKGATYTKEWMAERCDEIVQNNQSSFRELGDDIYSLLPDSDNPASPGNTKQTSCDYILRRRRG